MEERDAIFGHVASWGDRRTPIHNITTEGALSVNARQTRSLEMAAIARVLSRVLPETVFKDETLKIVVMLSESSARFWWLTSWILALSEPCTVTKPTQAQIVKRVPRRHPSKISCQSIPCLPCEFRTEHETKAYRGKADWAAASQRTISPKTTT